MPARRSTSGTARSAARGADDRGSYERIYAAVRRIPRGRVASYGRVAALAGLPRQARLVGYALHRLTASTTVPWHRVVNAAGRISLRATPDGGLLQRVLLEAGHFRAKGAVALDRFGWDGAPASGRGARSARRPVGRQHGRRT